MTNQSWKVNLSESGLRLDKWLADVSRLGSRSKAFEAIARGKVFVNETEQTAMDAGRKLSAGETVRVWMDKPGSSKQRVFTNRKVSDLHILYEDPALLVINKPAGLLTVPLISHPDETSLYENVIDYVLERSKNKPQIIHRIDRNTSGLVVFAKTGAVRENLKKQFALQKPERIYLAIVYGIPAQAHGTWKDWLIWDEEELIQKPGDPRDQRAVEALCKYRVVEEFHHASLLEIKLVTGRQNQIRVQAMLRKHQLIGEKQYLAAPASPIEFPRQALHAYQLKFLHPTTNLTQKFEAPVPEDFRDLLKKLRHS